MANKLITEALRLMDEEGLNAHAAAKQVDVPAASVYAAFNRRKMKWLEAKLLGVCTKCGAPVDASGKYTA